MALTLRITSISQTILGLCVVSFCFSRLCWAQESSAPVDAPPPTEEVEPLDPWTPIAPSETTDSTIRTTNRVGEKEQPKTPGQQSTEAVEEEVIEIKAMVTEPGLKKVDPEQLLREELSPDATDLTKKELKRIEAAEKVRAEIAREQAAKLGINKKAILDPRGLPEVTICSINTNNYGHKKIWEATFRRSDIPKRSAMRRSIVKAVKEAACDLIAIQNILGKEDSDAMQSTREILGFKPEDQAGWEIILGSVNREVSRNAIVYRSKYNPVTTEKFSASRLTSFGSFKLDQFGIPPVRAEFEIPQVGSGEVRKVSLTSFTLKNSVGFSSDETEAKRIQLAEFLRGQTSAIKRSESESETIVVFTGNRAGPADSVGSQIIEGRYKLADFLSNGACSFESDGTVKCLPEKIRPKEFFGIIGASSPDSFAAVLDTVKFKLPRNVKKTKAKSLDPRAKVNLLASEIYMDGTDYYLGLSKAGAPGKFEMRMIPVRTGLPESPFLVLKLNW